MRVALVWPRSTFLSRSDVWPPLGLFYIGAQLEAQGHTCDYFDLSFDELPQDGDYDQLWLSGTSPQIADVKRIARETTNWTKTRRVIGGPAAWVNPASVMDLGFDLAVSGEGDHPDTIAKIVELAQNRAQKHLVTRISPNLDWVLPPVRRWATRYHSYMQDSQGNSYRMATMFTSRGCGAACAFCESGRNGRIWERRVRFEPIEVIESQIKELASLGFQGLAYYDDVLPIRRTRIQGLMELNRKYGMVWRCFLRSDLVCRNGGYAYMKEMRAGGLIEFFLGVESASDEIKQNISKGTTIAQDEAVLDWARSLGIRAKTSFILGLPGETRESMETTRAWILKHRPDRCQILRLIPFIGTPLTEHPEKYDLIYERQPEDEWFFKGREDLNAPSFVSTSHLTRDEIDTFYRALEAELRAEGIPA